MWCGACWEGRPAASPSAITRGSCRTACDLFNFKHMGCKSLQGLTRQALGRQIHVGSLTRAIPGIRKPSGLREARGWHAQEPMELPPPLLLPGCPFTAAEAVLASQHSHCYRVMPYSIYFVCISALQLFLISKGILKMFETRTQHKFIRKTARPTSEISKHFTSKSKRFCSQAS